MKYGFIKALYQKTVKLEQVKDGACVGERLTNLYKETSTLFQSG
jgi:hypothetical protein